MIPDPNAPIDPNDPYAAYRQRFPGAPLPPGAGAPPAPGASVPPGAGMPPGGGAPPPQAQTTFAPNPTPSPGIGNALGIDPASAGAMLSLGGRTADQMAIQRQQKMADMMRGSMQQMNDPKGNMVSGHYVGPNAGTAIGSALMGYMGGRAEDAAATKAGAMDKSRNKAMRGWFKSLTGVDAGDDEG